MAVPQGRAAVAVEHCFNRYMMAGPEFQRCSVIVPVLNDSGALAQLLPGLQVVRQQGHEVLVVDGGSDDDLSEVIDGMVDQFLESRPGRALQMNTAAEKAHGDVLWFLHADSQLNSLACIDALMCSVSSLKVWGRFDIKLSGKNWLLRLVEKSMNLRSQITGIATGDQGIFVSRQAFARVNGFADIPLMEDIEISRCLKKLSRPLCLRPAIITSSRRWERQGILKTILSMWLLRLGYYSGISSHRLAKYYKTCSSPMQK